MLTLHFIVDGKRDKGIMPRLVEGILGTEIQGVSRAWFHLRGRSGYKRKLQFGMISARLRCASGVVATVDTDKQEEGKRLKVLRSARQELRNQGESLPVALGEASPHAESWLLDDPKAVREALQLPSDTMIPTVRDARSPKQALDAIIEASPRNGKPADVLPDIARRVNLKRCAHSKETGFEFFVKDVQGEIGPLCREPRHEILGDSVGPSSR